MPRNPRTRRRLVAAAVVIAFVAVAAGTRLVRDPSTTSDLTPVSTPEPTESVSRNGDDFSVLALDNRTIVLCDTESDHNPVRADVVIGSDQTVTFVDASDTGECTRYVADTQVLRHRICERNHLLWNCSNFTAPNSPAQN